jgi:CIC family chloride channel protein
MKIKSTFQFFIGYLRTRLSRPQLIMVIASLTGFTSGLIAVLLKTLVHYVQHWIKEIPVSYLGYLLFPALGLLITVFSHQAFF